MHASRDHRALDVFGNFAIEKTDERGAPVNEMNANAELSERSTPKSLRERTPESASAVSRKVLLGIVPVLIPAPPISRSFSTSATRLPNILAVFAPEIPAGPPPITTRS